ncbi:TetR family transcriptional regulator C-terminal domain-containing protein [Glacieibacterium megasporae]|uniref:TetR family transcriptional regulator C-terminal domain-containing protein n=1 Tax=Glacieibacterium megasporae TaxID=2835787 RepID=UPI001C1E66E5|nr:TetR family transcriptional regulator C-terminal domain-containing protein [Polymorphobacter megasporae]UAJ10586.1 TetR family transcriptional regulator C-terminal domain-containing protein [Polymorphobacter megasporae]
MHIALGLIEYAPDEHDLALETREIRDRERRELLKLLDAGLAAGELEQDADTEVLARFLASVFEGLSIQARDGATVSQLQAVGRAAASGLPWAKGGT